MDYLKNGNAGENITWEYEDGIMRIVGTGEMIRFENDNDEKRRTVYDPHCLAPWYGPVGFLDTPVPRDCKEVIISEGITGIHSLMFSNWKWKSLERVEIPESVGFIGELNFDFKERSQQLVIVCKKGSYAEQYAKENHFRIEYIVN